MLPCENSRSFLKFRNWPCAVSGRKNTGEAELGPIDDLNIKLKAVGSSTSPPPLGLRISKSLISLPSSGPPKLSIYNVSACHLSMLCYGCASYLCQDLFVLGDCRIFKLVGLFLGIGSCCLGVCDSRFEDTLDEMVGAQVLALGGVLAHPIGELLDVATGFQNSFGSNGRAVDLQHILFNYEVFSPFVRDVGQKTTAGGTIVEQTTLVALVARRGTVYFKGLGEEKASSKQGFELGPVQRLASKCGRFRHRECVER